MTETVLKAIYGSPETPLKIGEIEIPCYVLEDGKRVIHQRGMLPALNIARGGSSKGGGDRLAHFVSSQVLKPFISEDLLNVTTQPIKFRTPKGSLAYGYEANVLAEICDAVLAARKAGVLQKQQAHIAEQCEVLMRGFAMVGIVALIDEVTGYQEVRERDALHKILEAYISKELLPWTKKFPDDFYKEMFRLRGWDYNPMSVKRPKFVGYLTDALVYKKLPPGVLEKLKESNPKNDKGNRLKRHHQFLSEDIGNTHLEKQIAIVTTLMRISPDWRRFKGNFERAFPTDSNDQLTLDVETIDED